MIIVFNFRTELRIFIELTTMDLLCLIAEGSFKPWITASVAFINGKQQREFIGTQQYFNGTGS